MKVKPIALTAGLALGIGASGLSCAHPQRPQQTKGRQSETSPQPTYITGSYLPQVVERHGPVTNGKDNVRVIDRSEIERTGGADVEQTLRKLGATH